MATDTEKIVAPENEEAAEPTQEERIEQREELVESIQAPTAPPEPVEPEPEASPATEVEWRNDQLATGHMMGLTADQVKAFGDPAAFDAVANRVVAAVAQQDQDAPPTTEAPETTGESGAEAFTFKDKDDYDEEIVRMNDHYAGRMTALEEHVANMQFQTRQIQVEAAGREIDAILNTMDEGLYGRGRLNEVPEESAMNRIRVADQLARDGDGFSTRGEPMPPMDEMVVRASQTVHGKQLSNNALQRVSDKAGQVARQATALPTHREEAQPLGTAKAEAAVREFYETHGVPGGVSVEDALIE